jgi:predicted DNA-binding transcriptional regulator
VSLSEKREVKAMNKDTVVGVCIVAASIAGVVIFGWLLLFSEWRLLVLELIAFLAISVLLVVAGWIGYTLAATSAFKTLQVIDTDPQKNPEEVEE